MPEAPRPAILTLPPGEYWWCTCGRSSHLPHCDGSHKGSGCVPEKQILETTTTVAFCHCKLSQRRPYCDGSHNQLPAS